MIFLNVQSLALLLDVFFKNINLSKIIARDAYFLNAVCYSKGWCEVSNHGSFSNQALYFRILDKCVPMVPTLHISSNSRPAIAFRISKISFAKIEVNNVKRSAIKIEVQSNNLVLYIDEAEEQIFILRQHVVSRFAAIKFVTAMS